MDAFLPNFRELNSRGSPDPSLSPTVADVKPADAAPLVAQANTSRLNAELKAYVEQVVVETVSQAIATVLPDVVESTLAHQKQSRAALPSAPAQPIPYPDNFESFEPGRYQGSRPIEAKQDLAAWCSVGMIVAVMGGVVAYAINLAPPAQTNQQNQRLTIQLTQQSEQLLESNQQILESKQRCGDFSLICNIKE